MESHAYIIRVKANAPIKGFQPISSVKHVICFRTLFLPVQGQKYHPKLWAHGEDYVLFSLVILYSAFWYCKALVYNHRPLLIFFLLSSWTNNKMHHADGFVRCWLVIYISVLYLVLTFFGAFVDITQSGYEDSASPMNTFELSLAAFPIRCNRQWRAPSASVPTHSGWEDSPRHQTLNFFLWRYYRRNRRDCSRWYSMNYFD